MTVRYCGFAVIAVVEIPSDQKLALIIGTADVSDLTLGFGEGWQ